MTSNANASVCVVSYHCDESSNCRPKSVRRALLDMPSFREVTIASSNFDHICKRIIPDAANDIVRLPVRPYRENISVTRLLSYWDFARNLQSSALIANSGIVYVCVPDYISALAILRMKRSGCFRLIIDVVDLWPEALPLPPLFNGLMKGTIGVVIKKLRQRLFNGVDLVLVQSRYFLSKLGGDCGHYGFLPMCFSATGQRDYVWGGRSISKEIRILFLGSMNSITDWVSLVKILCLLAEKRKVYLSVVGGGNSLEQLRQRLQKTPVITTFHGITFDETVKDEELSLAHFGFNGYKRTTEVSVSYKSLEYLQHGLPLINSAKGDTFELVRNEKCGFNYDPNDLRIVANAILSLTDDGHSRMRQNALRAFDANFSYHGFCRTLAGHMGKLLIATPSDGLR